MPRKQTRRNCAIHTNRLLSSTGRIKCPRTSFPMYVRTPFFVNFAGQDVRSVPLNHALESLGGQNAVSGAVDFEEHFLPVVCNCDFCFSPKFVESKISRLCPEVEYVCRVVLRPTARVFHCNWERNSLQKLQQVPVERRSRSKEKMTTRQLAFFFWFFC